MKRVGQNLQLSDFVLAATAENVDRDRIKEQVLLW